MSNYTCTVLIVEDFLPDQELYRRSLRSDGSYAYRFLEAETAEVALELCQTQPVDAILLDYSLPDADGLMFLEALHQRFNGGIPPVVVITGQGDETVAARSIKLGAEDYLVKGRFTPDMLRLSVRSAIENARLRLQLQQCDDRFRVSIENMLDCFGICSAIRNKAGGIVDFRIDYLNAAAMQSNQSTDADIGRRLCEMYPAHRETGLFEAYCQVVETGEPLIREELIFSDVFGKQFLNRAFDIHASKLDDGLVLSWRDVTARKQAELERQQQQERERIVHQITQQIRRSLNLEEVLNTAVTEVREHLSADRAFLYRFDPDFSGRIVVESVVEGLPSVIGAEVQDTCFMETHGEDYRQGRIQVVEDIYTAGLTNCHVEMLARFQIRANLVVPILQGEQLWGLLVLSQCACPRSWQPSEVDLGQQLAAQIGIAIQQAELYQQMQESQQRLELSLESSQQGIWDYDIATDRAYWSPQCKRLFGLDPDDSPVSMEQFLGYIHSDDRDRVAAAVQALYQTNQDYDVEYRVVWTDGTLHWLHAQGKCLRDGQGQPYKNIGTVADISQRKRDEELLNATRNRLELSLEGSQQGIWEHNLATNQMHWSPQCKRLFGLDPNDAVVTNEQFSNCLHPDDRDRVAAAIAQTLQTQSDYDDEYRVLWADGTIHWMLAKGRVLHDSQGQAVQMVGTVMDVTQRKQTEAALLEGERRFRELFNTTYQFIGLLTPDGILLEANETALNFAGLTREEAIGCPFWEIRWWTISPQTQQQLQDAIRRARGGEFVRYEVEILGRGDSTTTIDFSLKPMRDESGQVVLLIPEGRDISDRLRAEADRIRHEGDRKRAEERLRQSEERLQLGVRVAGLAIAHVDYASNQVTLSPEAAAMFGIPAAERVVTRDCIHATFHPEERDELLEVIQQVLDPAGNGWFAREHRVVWQTGEVRWLSVRKQVFFQRSGATLRPDYAILAAIDITERKHVEDERKQAEAALRHSEERYRSLAGLIPQLVWIADSVGTMLDVNDRWSTYTGLTLAQAQSQGWEAVVHPEDISVLGEAWTVAQPQGKHYQAEGRMRRADGIYRWHLHQAMPLKDQQGQIVKWFGTATDIHELKLIEVERDRLLAEAEAARTAAETANRSKDDFVSLVAHELRSPLNAIMGWAQLLQSRQLDGATTARALETIARNTQAQVQLVEDLLDVSRMVRGSLQLTLESVNLIKVIEEAIETVRPTAEAKGVRLETQLDTVALISGDPNRLRQVVLNLLTNAIKFTPADGQVEVRLEQYDAQARLQVRDTGKGISPDFLPHIFERFRQDQQNATAKQGLGLGLAIVKHLVESHKGTVMVESQGEGLGATFTILLPLLNPAAAENERSALASISDANALSLTGVRVLLVDDEPDMLDLTQFLLEQYGAIVQTATRAVTALEQLQPFQPDILLSDIAMPEQNGYTLLQQVQSLYSEAHLPAIALTAYASHTQREESLRAGFREHLTKPVEPEALVEAILKAIGRIKP